jgi:hypothetical protein
MDSLLSASPIFIMLLLLTKISPFHSVRAHVVGRAEPPKPVALDVGAECGPDTNQ